MTNHNLELIRVSELSQSLQELIKIIGIENTYRMTCAFGGATKYIPKKAGKSALSNFLDEISLKKLSEHFAGTNLEINKADSFKRQIRNHKICKEVKSGKSYSCVANKYGLSTRHIVNILSKNR